MAFEDMRMQAFLDEVASNSPAPGGGSVAALCGSLAAALVSMVSNLTVGKEKYKENWAVMEELLSKGEALRTKFVVLMNKDTESFNAFMTALKMPRDTDEQKAKRKKAMQEASMLATEIPLTTLEACAEAAGLALRAAKHGNPKAASDAGSAALLAEAAGKAASYNVRINLPGITDETFVAVCRKRMSDALVSISHYCVEASAVMDKLL